MSGASSPVLCFVRHGETEWNRLGRMQGAKDIPLNEQGCAQAEAVGQLLATIPGIASFDFVSSPMIRARTTMDLARRQLGLDADGYAVDERLRERSWGAWEGFTLADVKQADPESHRHNRSRGWDFAPPGGESYAMLADRLAGWFDRLDRPTVAVSHAGVARALLGLLTPLPRDELARHEIAQGRILVFEAGTHRWI